MLFSILKSGKVHIFLSKSTTRQSAFFESCFHFLEFKTQWSNDCWFFPFPSYLYAYLSLDGTNNYAQLATYQVFHIPMILTYFVSNKPKGRISKPVFQENKAHQIFRKTNISYSLIRRRRCAYQGLRNVCFSENSVSFVFLKHLFWDSPFCLITDDFRRTGYIPSEYWIALCRISLMKKIK